MRSLRYHVASTLDGFIAHKDDTWSGFPQEGDHVEDYAASLSGYDTVIMGRRTYEPALALGVTNPYPMIRRKIVFSRSLKQSPDPENVQVTAESPADVVRRLKEEEGSPIYLCGGADLAGQLFDAGLIDEVLLKLNPRIFGAGVPLVGGHERVIALALESTKVYRSGVVLLGYRVER